MTPSPVSERIAAEINAPARAVNAMLDRWGRLTVFDVLAELVMHQGRKGLPVHESWNRVDRRDPQPRSDAPCPTGASP